MSLTTVIAYHAIGECGRSDDPHDLFVPTDAFESQMDYLARRRRVVSVEELITGSLPPGPPPVAITFDDGYRSVLTTAAPILQAHGFPATVFVPTRWVGVGNTWDEPSACDLAIMDADELRTVEGMGVTVESHGHAHIDLEASGREAVRADLVGSLEHLEKIIGRRPRYLAYPYGRSSTSARAIAEATGFEAAFSIAVPSRGRYALGRVEITPFDGPRLFALKTSGRYLGLRHAPVTRAGYRIVKPVVRKLLRR